MTAYNCWKCLPDETAEGRHVPSVRLILPPNTRVSKNTACQKNQPLPTREPESKQDSSAKSALLETLWWFPINNARIVSEPQAAAVPHCSQPPLRSCPRPHAPTSAPGTASVRSFSFPRRTFPRSLNTQD